MFAEPAPRVFALPPGADFAARLAEGLAARLAGSAPEAMARVTLFLNTARMRERVRQAFLDRVAGFLPRLRLVSDLGQEPLPGLPPPLTELRRRLDLAALVGGLMASEARAVPSAARMDLAESLARLLDEMQEEGVTPAQIAGLDVADHAEHWARTQTFMAAAAPYLDGAGAGSAAARQRAAVARLAESWASAPPSGPVIVAGSTGSRGPTLKLMAAVARLPQGALVLPGFDFDLPPDAWAALASETGGEDHPQFRFRRLLDELRLDPTDVRPWDGAGAPDPARNRLVSLALRPPPVTDRWLAEGPALGDALAATAGLTLVEAPSPRAEAAAIALILRRAADEGRRAALVTPDRDLTRRVAAQLDRWGIIPDDSAGLPLMLSPPGRFLRHVAGLAGARLTAEALVVLLKHPLAAAGPDRGLHLSLSRRLELRLRRSGPAFPDADFLRRWATEEREPAAAAWAEWLAATLESQTDADPGPQPLPRRLARLRALSEALSAGPQGTGAGALWDGEAGEKARGTLDRLAEAGEGGDLVTAAEFYALLDGLLAGEQVRVTVEPHPLVLFRGTLEARARDAELVILAGLNEGVWPAAPAPDPWLNRRLRLAAGLLLPERQVGLSAHDFQQAIAAPEVVLTRATRDDEAATVPSRWLNRLTGLLGGLAQTRGPQALAAMRERGAAWLALADRLDEPAARMPPAVRPAPRPPAAARPAGLAVTEVADLLHDPYAVYARRILELRPLPPFRGAPDARDRGTLIHRILEAFARGHVPAEDRAAARARLVATADEVLAAAAPWPAARLFWRARMRRAAGLVVDLAAERGGQPVRIEAEGRAEVGETGVILRGRPDRIDRRPDGRLWLFDYKSGAPPKDGDKPSVDNQLLLLAAMAERGAFGAVAPGSVAGATFVGLNGETASPVVSAETLSGVWAELAALIARMADPAVPYTAWRSAEPGRQNRDYAHLSRHGEWRTSDPPRAEDVG